VGPVLGARETRGRSRLGADSGRFALKFGSNADSIDALNLQPSTFDFQLLVATSDFWRSVSAPSVKTQPNNDSSAASASWIPS
jgi:hypothetical protein